ncbi:MAG: hypothetical protein H6718_23580 [Polyangiaceae bacterium]|nr:hypothetical protein [Myxococcales bacterium]MCB9588410.1 hypothetical protein [Polyangiaceae bacterium]
MQADIVCGAERSGSGLRGLSFTLTDQDGQAIPGGTSQSESSSTESRIDNLAIPAGTKQVRLTVSAASQATDVSSTFYRCGVTLHAP